MATNHTANYQLNLWEPDDAFLRTEFNENSSKIDAALGQHDTALAQLPGINQTLANYSASLNKHDTELGERLRCVTGSYVGTGASSWTLNFGAEAKVVIITRASANGHFTVLVRGQAFGGLAEMDSSVCGAVLTWSGNRLQFKADSSAPSCVFQVKDVTYLYAAFY